MFKPSLAFGVLAFTASLALAQTTPSSPPAKQDPGLRSGASEPRNSGTGHAGHHARDLKGQQAAKVTLAQAIEAAERRGQGRAIGAEFETRSGTGHYEVRVLGDDGKLVEHHVDAASGQVTESEGHPIEGFFTRLKPADVQNAHTTLRQAVALAEQKAGGRAAEAKAEHDGDAVRYTITVANGDRTHEVRVDTNGQAVMRD